MGSSRILIAATFIGSATLFGCNSSEQSTPQQVANDAQEVVVEAKEEALTDSLSKEIIQATFKTLSSNLKHQIKTNGVDSALAFCNVNALPLTDSLSAHYGVTIQRLAKQNRNPKNALTPADSVAFEVFSTRLINGENPGLYTGDANQKYAPIIMQEACLKCHGAPNEQIQPSTLAKVAALYPNDKAVNFKVGDLRGIWKITMN